ncbi:hypothetical protein KK062_11070 [Fulvivirgaceae bacterium PWU5]|uniref:PA14 domain-containing protein n=1 Tax=Dawidia cretensis TaxID=2782350 RepID=A0AAP2DWA3_9BACT|nr:hypothetical protein [Dawidia cretensis]MBT1708770.1 hypothetical protein [Dawidia cretensis]
MIRILKKAHRPIALFLAWLLLFELLAVPTAYALTSGPTQPEVQSFQPAGTTDMVDLFSGDFSYNIPLFELPGPNGGYPFNLSYQSGVSMDAEASWVGLGFNLSPGAITRQMRGLPDEFKGDSIYTKMAVEPSVTVGLGVGVNLEVFGAAAEIGSIGLSVTQNNTKGLGYSIDASLGFKGTASSGMTGGIGLDISLNSKEGVNVNPNLSVGGKMGEFGLGAGYNSKSGLHNVSFSHSYQVKNEGLKRLAFGGTASSSAAISLAHPGYTPQVTMPMRNFSISAQFKPGGSWWGLFANGYIRGFYSEQWLHNNKKRIRTDAYGYMHYQDGLRDNKALLDYNREKDGMVMKESPNLAIPSLTYDIYSVAGQGISAMYRPMRNDYGILRDPETSSVSVGGSIGVDVGPAASHVGVNLSVNHSKSTSGGWGGGNDIASHAAFQDKSLNDRYEPWYFKVHGEHASDPASSTDAIGGTSAVRVRLTGDNFSPKASRTLENSAWNGEAPNTATTNRARKSRSQVIQTITNAQLLKGTEEVLSYLKVKYRDAAGTEQVYNRKGLPGHHIAAFTALTPEGLRYNYGIPAYNFLQEEATFSARKQTGQTSNKVHVGNNGQADPYFEHSDSEKFLKKTELPRYAHSYLLTSIIGPDYVDVTGDGVSEDDLGYWVKFTYTRKAAKGDAYKWRDPFSKAHFQEGWKTDPRDDKGSYVYGEKEIWYLAQAETKSHITTFTLQEREDGRGVAMKLQDNDLTGKAVYALKEIRLFSRSAGTAHPIKVVKFDYDYSLCPGVFNSNTGGGKLTLKRVWFEHGNSQRGSLNPYVFTYHSFNPSYDQHAYDRWGNYKNYPAGDFLHNVDFPYVDQDPLNKEQRDRNVAAWSLREIDLPSGGKIMVDYESDDYGYVQHLPAMQMMALVDPYTSPAQVSPSSSFSLRDNDLKVRFKLERGVAGTLNAGQQRDEILKYVDQRRQLHFKIKVNLRSVGENFHEYVSGYADIDMAKAMGLEKDGSGDYVYGYFYVKAEEGHHPLSMRAWQHVRTNQPDLANSGRKLKQTESAGARVDQIKSLGSVFTQVRQMFEGFYNFCNNKGWGKELVGNKSWIRLYSPDKIKYGGGLRVRQITMKDNWAEDEEGIYGQVYEYTTQENGQTISSGVSAYEPLVGGEENPLRYAKKYVQAVPLRSDNNLFFEYPINESYYPGPSVGYSKVTVMSLASASLAGKDVKNTILSDGKKLFPEGAGISFGTSGTMVHEFYTAKDFPVLADETEKANKSYKLSVPIPFLGNVSISKLTASQGYSIVTNDMHGKQKQVSTFRQDKAGKTEPDPISWIKYNYSNESRMYQQTKVQALTGVMKDNSDGTLSLATSAEIQNPTVPKFAVGQENEFFMDMREYQDVTWEGGARVNLDIVYIPLLFVIIPVPVTTVWPSVSRSETLLKTAVTNKVIFRTGILESVESYDGGSLVKTSNAKWDKLTGTVVLTVVNNNFDAPVYNYTIPAYTQYQGMGAAYQNVGTAFQIHGIRQTPYKTNLFQFNTDMPGNVLFPGDEIMLYEGAQSLTNPVARVIYVGEEDGRNVFYADTNLNLSEYKAMIVRSGYRNQLTVSAGSISALKDPTLAGTPVVHEKTITIPKGTK